ncbi:hypothetical protein LSAT2_017268 [Lamellibrachia satsuma]|nr:hypothetical protein LSAT2_017268 [Lamellibrachia satsuma]
MNNRGPSIEPCGTPVFIGTGQGSRGSETGGRGGGIIYMTIPDRMKIDGEVSSNGEAGNPLSQGGSDSTVHIHPNLIQGYAKVQTEGDGYGVAQGVVSPSTLQPTKHTRSFNAYGGLSQNGSVNWDGSAGTPFTTTQHCY